MILKALFYSLAVGVIIIATVGMGFIISATHPLVSFPAVVIISIITIGGILWAEEKFIYRS